MLDEFGEPIVSKNGKTILRPSYSVLQDTFFNAMSAAGYDDVERGQRGSTEEHLTVTQIKVQQEQRRLEALQEALQQTEQEQKEATKELHLLTSKVNHAAKLAKQFSDDPPKALPATSFAESAKSYRKNKAKPAWKKIVKVLRSVYSLYM